MQAHSLPVGETRGKKWRQRMYLIQRCSLLAYTPIISRVCSTLKSQVLISRINCNTNPDLDTFSVLFYPGTLFIIYPDFDIFTFLYFCTSYLYIYPDFDTDI